MSATKTKPKPQQAVNLAVQEINDNLRRIAGTPDDFERWVDFRRASRNKKRLEGMRLAWWEITTVREALRHSIKNRPPGQMISAHLERLWRKINRRYLEIQFKIARDGK